MPDSNYTITRYDYPILGGVAAHGYYALERTNPDGTTTPIAALHGMATNSNNEPQPIGLPWDNDTIKVHQFQNLHETQDGIAPSNKVPTRSDIPPVWPGSIRRTDLGPMTQDEATGTFNRMLQGGAAINDKGLPYSIFGINSNTVNKNLGELAHDPSIGKMAQDGSSPGQGGELNKPGYGLRILSPDETQAIDPEAPILSHPQPDSLGIDSTPRSILTRPDGSRTETHDNASSTDYDASGTALPPAPNPAPTVPPALPSPPAAGPTSLNGGAPNTLALAPPTDATGSDATGAPSLAANAPATDDGSLTDQDVAELTPNFAPDQLVMNGLDQDVA